VQIPEIVESVLRMADGRLRTQRILCRREFHAGPPVLVDPDMIRRAVVNVVGNAIDAMPDGGELRIAAGPGEDGGYELSIVDTGAGIPAENRDKIFDPYFTTKPSGLGLGLVLTRKIVEAHGGKIVLDSQPGNGTRIRILLPREPAG
jgi:signal transduction histidine kinase